jgi:O-antigen/teichoic acid export membrane protein
MIPLVLILNTFAFEGLSLWLGRKFADHSTIVFQLISVGVLFNAIAQVPYGLIQGQGRPDLTAKLHVFELPIYLVILWILIKQYGIVGAAFAWLVRAVFDMIGLFVLAQKYLALRSTLSYKRCIVVAWILILIFSSMCFSEIRAKLVFTFISLGAYSLFIWSLIQRSNKKNFCWK